jgi:hypothetical protein
MRDEHDRGMQFLLLPLLVLLATEGAIDHERVEGWPELEIVEHHVPHAVMRSRCAKYVGFGMAPIACAEFDLAGGRCHVWFSADFPPSKSVLEHERLHCQGYDHPGETTMRDILARFNASQLANRGQSPISASTGE